jgi:hypothetical protein
MMLLLNWLPFFRDMYSGPIKLDTETGHLKVYNYGHAQTL